MLACEQRVLAPARLVNGAVDDPSDRVTDLACRDVEIVDVHDVRPVVSQWRDVRATDRSQMSVTGRRAVAFERQAARADT
jgi:hypothetical protein